MSDEQSQSARREIVARAADRHQANRMQLLQLMVIGHGTALLALFNARASGQAGALNHPTWLAAIFVAGLISAFAACHSVLGGENSEIMAVIQGRNKTEEHRRAIDENSGLTSKLFLFSAACFVVGLLWAISVLG